MNRVTFYTDIKTPACREDVLKACEGRNLFDDFQVDYTNVRYPATFALKQGVQPEQVQKLIKEAGYKAEIVDEISFPEQSMDRDKN